MTGIKKPTDLFINLAYEIEQMKNKIELLLTKNILDSFLNKLIQFVLFSIEYIFYWDYHINSPEFKFLIDKPLINQIDLKINELPLIKQCMKLSQITDSGLNQFIFDINFFCIYLNQFLAKDSHVLIIFNYFFVLKI